jgi:hypothetical protein
MELILLDKLIVAQLAKNFQHCMENEYLLTYSQERATIPYYDSH